MLYPTANANRITRDFGRLTSHSYADHAERSTASPPTHVQITPRGKPPHLPLMCRPRREANRLTSHSRAAHVERSSAQVAEANEAA